MRLKRSDKCDCIDICHAQIKILQSLCNGSKKNDGLSNLIAIYYCELGMCLNEVGKYDANVFLDGFNIWSKLFVDVPLYHQRGQKITLFEKFESSETNAFLEYLGTYLDNLHESRLLIIASRIHLQVLSTVKKSLEMNGIFGYNLDVVRIYIRLAGAYHNLGYSGRSGLLLGVSKSMLNVTNSELKSSFFTSYGIYLNAVGNSKKRFRIFNI